MARVDKYIADIDGQVAKIMQLFNSKNTAEAARVGAALRQRIESDLLELKAKTAFLEQRLPMVQTFAATGGQQMSLDGLSGVSPPPPLNMSQKRERSAAIVRIAQELLGKNDVFSTDDVARAVAENGVEMGVPAKRVNTAIGATLRKHKDEFDKFEPGLYRKKRASYVPDEDGAEAETVIDERF